MECPYNECNCNIKNNNTTICPGCNRKIKLCNKCSKYNRIYSVYCRNCGEILPDDQNNWLMAKGGYSKSGLNHFDIGFSINDLSDLKKHEISKFYLSGPCKSILIYENFLFAISLKGEIQIFEIFDDSLNKKISFNAGDVIYSEAAIANGSLYVGTKDYLHAYSLCKLLANEPSSEPRWQQGVTGTPIKSLIPINDTLYFNLIFDDKHQEIHALTNIKDNLPDVNVIHEGPYLSSIAANIYPKIQKIFFFSCINKNSVLHVIDQKKNFDEVIDIPLKKANSKFNDKIPVSVLGTKVFVVFEGKNMLCQIDSKTGFVDKTFAYNIKEYAMASITDPVIVNSKGLLLARSDFEIDMTSERQQVKGAPLILNNRGIVVGMDKSSVVRIYDILNPTYPKSWVISDNNPNNITAIASSKNIIAAGDQKGTVRISKLLKK